MPDIDSLSINLTASAGQANTAINSIIESLNKLNGALSNYSAESKYVQGLNNLVGGFKDFSSTINSIDIQKIKSLSTTIGALAGNGEKLAKLNFVSTFADMGSTMQKVNSQVKQTTGYIMDAFDMPKSKYDDMFNAVKKLYGTAGNDTAFKKASADIREMVTEAQKSKAVMSDVYKNVRSYINKSTINIPKRIMDAWGDNAISNRATIGIPSTTTQPGVGMDLESAIKEMHDYYGATVEVDGNLEDMANSLVRFLDDEKAMANVHTDFSMLGDIIDSVYYKINELTTSFETMKTVAQSSDEEFMEPTGVEDFSEIQVEATNASNSVYNVAAAVEQLKAELSTEIANPFEGIIKGVEALNEVQSVPLDKFAGISQLASTIGKFGSKNSDKAIANIPKFGRAFAQMATQLASAPAISNNLVRLAEAMSKYSGKTVLATENTRKFSNVSKLLNGALQNSYGHSMRAHRGFTSLAAIFGTLYANFFLLIRAARLLGQAMDYSSSMTEAQNVVSVTFGKQADVLDKFAQTAIKDFGIARLSAVQFASRFQAMGKTMGITSEEIVKANSFITSKVQGNARAYKDLGDSVADMSVNLTKLTADMASLYNQDYEEVADDMAAIYTGMTRPLRKYGLDLTQATLKEWALANGLDADIEKMTQAEKTLLRYQYVMSKTGGAMGDFAKTADTWANTMRTVKQYLQEIARVLGEGLINALRPALISFRNFLANFLTLAQNALNAVGKLLGWKKIDFGGASLVEDMEDYADAIDDASGAAKKLKGQLRGIDELNNLTTNPKGGAGGGGSAIGDLSDKDLWEDILDTEKNYESKIKSWFELGRKIAEAFKNGLQSIDWERIFDKAIGTGTNLASFLNGLIDPETWREFGRTLGNGVMTAIKFAFALGDTFDWENLGTSISEGILGFFEKFDGGEFADTIDVWVQGIWTTIKTAISKLFGNKENRDSLFEDVSDFVFGLDIKTVQILSTAGITVLGTSLVTGAIAAAIMKNPVTVGAIGITILGGYLVGTKISEVLEDALGTNQETGESKFYEWWETVFDFWSIPGMMDLIKPVAVIDAEDMRKKLFGEDNFFDQTIYLRKLKKEARAKMKSELSGMWLELFGEAFGQAATKQLFEKYAFGMDPETVIKPIRDLWNNIRGPLSEFDEKWEEFWTNVFDFWNMDNGGPLEALGVFDWLDEKTEALIDLFKNFSTEIDWASLTEKTSAFLLNIVGLGDPAASEGILGLGDAFNNLSDSEGKASAIVETLKEKFTSFKDETATILKNWWDNDIAPKFDLSTWTELVSSIKESIKTVWEDTVKFWSDEVPIWWDEHVAVWFERGKWDELVRTIKDSITTVWTNMVTWWNENIQSWWDNNVAPWFTEETWLGALDGILRAFESVWGDAREFARGFFNNVAQFAEDFINGVIDGFKALAGAKSIFSDSPIEFNVGHVSLPRFANGGFPQVGSLFIAGEAGSEMVGSINGRTGVASHGEITGIADAIRSTSGTEIELLREQNVLLQGILEKEFGISGDSLFKSVRTLAREYTRRTGNPAW